MNENNVLWRSFWPERSPADIDPPFYRDGEALVSLDGLTRLEFPRIPDRTVADVAPAAFRCGAVLVDRWPVKWGVAVAFSLPGTECAWFLLDDFAQGHFAALGVRIISDIAFAFPTAFYWGDEDQAARFALSYGFKRNNQRVIESVLAEDPEFPHKDKRLQKLFGPLGALQHLTVTEGLQYLQRVKGVNPQTAIAATETIEVLTT